MANRTVQHTELDNAIRSRLLKLQGKTQLEWTDVEKLLSRKHDIPSAVPRFSFSLNSISLAVSSNVTSHFNSTFLFAKRWSNALYILTAAIVITAGSYYFFGRKIGPSIPVPVSVQTIVPANNTAIPVTAVEAPSEPATDNPNADNPNTENQNTEKASPVRVAAPVDNQKTSEKSVQTNQISSADGSESDSQVINKTASDSAAPAGETATNNSKILYYKESLSLDKLEEELSKDGKDSLH